MKRGLLLVFLTAIISGVSIFANSFGVKGVESTVYTFAKNSLVALLLISILFAFRDYKSIRNVKGRDWLWLTIVGLVGGAVPFVMFFKGLQMTNGPIGAFIHKTMFVFVAVWALVFLKERFSWKIFVPAALLLAGNFILLNIRTIDFSMGALLVLGATLLWSIENTISKALLKRINPTILASSRLGFGSFFILAYLFLTGKGALITAISAPQLLWISVAAVFLLMYVLTWYSGLKEVKVTTATSILLLGSPITLLLSHIFLGNALTLFQVFGMLLVLAGVVSMTLLLEGREKVSDHSETSSTA